MRSGPAERDPAVVLVTGVQAAGKSTVAQLLAERLPRSVHLRGDVFRRMVVGGREDMTPDPSEEAVRQLRLRHRLTAATADAYREAGFTVVAQDVVLGPHLAEVVGLIRSRPLLVVVLAPGLRAIAEREAARAKHAYDEWTAAALDDVLRHGTPRLGLWLDTSEQTPDETVAEILDRAWTEARVP
ncbi:AAA family ATPase [Saccharothrix algeriensis]|uniref:AAA family ATPase n=1 Tax=Saccharothrix algeriensis TaxID=173560 RepID=A0A8T8I0Q5_9PSEU|nr:AAA family ATPase [Saccharothrix algeriensis]MBM7809995.1 chloramphenicol 3-O-phosphotransferase [Saccharothrix algeriensis]QTR04239.1 AAA family ATPase [Saccharothrix algeriensis]